MSMWSNEVQKVNIRKRIRTVPNSDRSKQAQKKVIQAGEQENQKPAAYGKIPAWNPHQQISIELQKKYYAQLLSRDSHKEQVKDAVTE